MCSESNFRLDENATSGEKINDTIMYPNAPCKDTIPPCYSRRCDMCPYKETCANFRPCSPYTATATETCSPYTATIY